MASRSKKVHKTTPLVATILGKDKDWSHLPAFQYGREHEKDAKDAFIKLESLKHRSFTVKECGLYVHPQYPYIAASPDGLCVCRCCPDMVLEIKCPSSIENLPIQEGWNKTEFLEMRGESICLKTSHKYYTQVQGQLALAKCKQAYFVVWTRIGEPMIEKIKFNQSHWKKVLHNLCIFFKSYVAKYLLGFEELHFCPLCDSLCLPAPEVDPKKKEQSVFCKVCEQHYHAKCIGLTTHELEDYICPGCED